MRGEWCYSAGKFSDEACDEIIALGKEYQEYEGTVGGGVSKDRPVIEHSIRQSSVSWLPRTDPRTAGIFSVLDNFAWEANNTWFGLDYQYHGVSSLQFTIYRGSSELRTGGDFYNTHADSAWISEHPSQRKISVVVQLSKESDYTGGDFYMTDVSALPPPDQIKRRGTVLSFPSIIRHGVKPVTSGTRYSLVGWYMGPPWR
jgi:PKHD-type hydroxylase